MPYIVVYHHKVKEEDLPSISPTMRKRIAEAVKKRWAAQKAAAKAAAAK